MFLTNRFEPPRPRAGTTARPASVGGVATSTQSPPALVGIDASDRRCTRAGRLVPCRTPGGSRRPTERTRECPAPLHPLPGLAFLTDFELDQLTGDGPIALAIGGGLLGTKTPFIVLGRGERGAIGRVAPRAPEVRSVPPAAMPSTRLGPASALRVIDVGFASTGS